MKPEEIAKAIVGALIAATMTAATALGDDSITSAEWVGIFLTLISTFGAVWGVPNAFTKLQLKQAKRELIDLGEVTATSPVSVWPTAQLPTVK